LRWYDEGRGMLWSVGLIKLWRNSTELRLWLGCA
jgi:hypothetical protein